MLKLAWGHVGTQSIPDSLAQGPSLGVEEGSHSGISGSLLGLLLNHPDSLDIYIDNLFPKIRTKQCNDRPKHQENQ
jgi:hypothetical protein